MNLKTLCLIGGLLAAAAPLSATPVTADGTYHEFLFGAVGTFATTCGGGCTATTTPVAEQTSVPPWTFTGAGNVFVLDLFLTGDEFSLYDNNALVGSTSIVPDAGTNPCMQDIACASGNSAYSRGLFALGSGSHSLTVQTLQTAPGYTSGAAVFSVSPAALASTPEPASFLLTGSGLSFLGLMRSRWLGRRRKR